MKTLEELQKDSFYEEIPSLTLQSFIRYRDHHILPGQFLRACLANDFSGAVARADKMNYKVLRKISILIITELPSSARGSYQIVEKWCRQ